MGVSFFGRLYLLYKNTLFNLNLYLKITLVMFYKRISCVNVWVCEKIFKQFSISSFNTEITNYCTKLHNVKIVHIKNISQIITLLQLLPICCRKKRIALKISSMQAWESLYLTRNFFIVLPYLIFPYKFDFHTKWSIKKVSLN